MYNQFAGNFDAQLNAVFAGFKTENIDNLIIDLRYNPGGFVSSATYLGGMITGQFEGELFSQQIWNNKVTQAWDAERFVNNFTNETYSEIDTRIREQIAIYMPALQISEISFFESEQDSNQKKPGPKKR